MTINWRTVAIATKATLGDAIRRIDESALQMAMVVDEEDKLIGMVTDGDVRRALLRGLGMEASVIQVMNANPRSLPIGASRAAQIAVMQKASIRQLPLLDEKGRVRAISMLAEQLTPPRRDNLVVLMAGGLGSRLSPLTDDCPKPMLAVGNQPLLQTILENFIAEGFCRFAFSVNYLSEKVEKYFGDGAAWNVSIDYIHETKRLGTAGALSLLPERPETPIVVMNGDLLTKVNFTQMLEFHEHYGADGTMGVRDYEFQVPYGVVCTDAHRIARIEEKPIQRFFINAGMYVLSPEAVNLIPSDTFYDMPALFSALVTTGRETAVFPVREYWLDIGHIADYQRANGDFSEVFR